MSGSYDPGSSGIDWRNGTVLTAQLMQQLDRSKANTSVIGKPWGIAQLDGNGGISSSVTGDVSGAVYGSGKLSDAFAGKINQTGGNALNLTGLGTTLATQQADGIALVLANQDPVSERSTIAFGNNGYMLMRDQPCIGLNNLALYNGATGNTPIRWDDDEQCAIYWSTDKALDDAFLGAGAALNINAYFGKNAPMSASGSALSVVANVYGVAPSKTAGKWPETSAIYTYTQYFNQYQQDRVHPICYDNHYAGPLTTDPAKRPEIMLGMSFRAANLAVGSELRDANGRGSFLYSACTDPFSSDELTYYGAPTTTPTQPFTAMFVACGWTGPNTVTGGDQNGAGPAALHGFLTGSGGGSVYLPSYNTRSRFVNSFTAGDWTDTGFLVLPPVGSSSTGAPQIGINNAWLTQLGGQPSDDECIMLALMPDQRAIKPNPASRKSVIYIAQEWRVGCDASANGGTDMFFHSQTAGKIMLQLDAGKVGFFGARPASQGTVGYLASDASQSDIINKINQLLTALGSTSGVGLIANQ